MKRVLIYSPDVIGHPRVYARVIADALAAEPCRIVVAMGFTDQVPLESCADLIPLRTREGVDLIDTRRFSGRGSPHLTAEELVALQAAYAVDTTLFIEADKSNDQFRRIAAGAAPRLTGRTIGIFANTAEWYPGEDSFTGAPRKIIASTLRGTIGNIVRSVIVSRRSPKFFYERMILRARVLDELLVKDERLAEWYGLPVYWMPEISRPASVEESEEEAADFKRSSSELGAFLDRNKGRNPVLYFGDAAFYKGYDLFLEFLIRTPSACGIHAGQGYSEAEGSKFPVDVERLRSRLVREGRLYERNAYVHTQSLKKLYFDAVSVYITTHRLALSSSTMIQAAEFGKPVLVPDRGLLKHRVLAHAIGDVYRYQDLDDLRRKAENLWSSDLSILSANATAFWQRFSDEAVRAFFVARLLHAA